MPTLRAVLEEDVALAGKATLRDLNLERPLIVAAAIAAHNDMLPARHGSCRPGGS